MPRTEHMVKHTFDGTLHIRGQAIESRSDWLTCIDLFRGKDLFLGLVNFPRNYLMHSSHGLTCQISILGLAPYEELAARDVFGHVLVSRPCLLFPKLNAPHSTIGQKQVPCW